MTARPLRSTTRLVLGALALLGLAAPAAAADLDEYPPPRFEGRGGWPESSRPESYRPEPSPAPLPPRIVEGPVVRGPIVQGPEACRVFVKRRFDAYGDEVVRRVRVCDEGPAYRDGPRWGGPRPWAHHRRWDDEPSRW